MGWVDPEKMEYHWLFASGTAATTLNTEMVYDIARNKWFEIDRTVDLQCGVLVHDTYGNSYNYGFLDTGYMERLEYGNPTVDGVTLTHYGDTSSTGTDKVMSPANTGYRLAQPEFQEKFEGDPFHSIKIVVSASAYTFDGNAITYTVQTGDFALSDLFTETRISDARLIMVAKTTAGFEPLALPLAFQGEAERTG